MSIEFNSPTPSEYAEEERMVSSMLTNRDENENTLRPKTLSEYAGQDKVKDKLSVYIEAARSRGDALDHVLLYGPPGLGKTTLATIIALLLRKRVTLRRFSQALMKMIFFL